MKAFEVRLCAMPSESDGVFVRTNLFSSRARKSLKTITSLGELETLSAELAAELGEPCVVWIGAANERARKPNGFEAETSRLAKVFRGGAA